MQLCPLLLTRQYVGKTRQNLSVKWRGRDVSSKRYHSRMQLHGLGYRIRNFRTKHSEERKKNNMQMSLKTHGKVSKTPREIEWWSEASFCACVFRYAHVCLFPVVGKRQFLHLWKWARYRKKISAFHFFSARKKLEIFSPAKLGKRALRAGNFPRIIECPIIISR